MKEAHKKKIGLANKGKRVNRFQGKLILVDGQKLCTTCEKWKPVSEYHKRPERPIGLKPKCIECAKEYRRQNPMNSKYSTIKSGATRREIFWGLTKQEFTSFWQKSCEYCDSEITTIGLDRVDSTRGYVLDNVVACCPICNVMKLALPRDVFIKHCQKVVNHSAVVPD